VGPTRRITGAWPASSLFLLALAAFLLVAAGAPPAQAVEKGIVENRLEYHGGIDLAAVPGLSAAMGPAGVNAAWSRVFVYWDQLEPKAPWQVGYAGYDQSYLLELDTVVQALRAQGIKVILTGSDTPSWARDTAYKKYWSRNPSTAVVRTADARVLSAFQGFAKFVAQHFAEIGVAHFEVWNEPNLRLQPQIAGRRVVGPEAYRKMLVAFSRGVHAGNEGAVVIAGATSRMGSNGTDAGSTSPQWFARYLKNRGASRWFDAYSHHPYSTRMSKPSPSAQPRRPDISVTLGNLPVLLKLFPTKPFYLTEYCYSTSANDAFVLNVSKADQARYLRQAYALCGTRAYRQVKVLLWFLVRDWQSDPTNPESIGVYTGLVDHKDQRKPSWWAFVGGNRVTIEPSASTVDAGSSFDITGALTTSEGPRADVTLQLQRRSLTGSTWQTVTGVSTKTDVTGAYAFQGITQTSAKRYRVIWDGVAESSQATVALAR
jgi:hypothetical protein